MGAGASGGAGLLHAKALAVAHTLAGSRSVPLRAKRLMRDAALIAQTMNRESDLPKSA